jgi:hypothetical protein
VKGGLDVSAGGQRGGAEERIYLKKELPSRQRPPEGQRSVTNSFAWLRQGNAGSVKEP